MLSSRLLSFTRRGYSTSLRGVSSPIKYGSHPKIGGLCFNLSGTTIDAHGNLAVNAIQEAFLKWGLRLTATDIRRVAQSHQFRPSSAVSALLNCSEVKEQWQELWNRYPSKQDQRDFHRMHGECRKRLLSKVQPLPGVEEAIRLAVQKYNPVVTFISRFTPAQLKPIQEMGIAQGFNKRSYLISNADNTPFGIYRAMELGNVYPACRQYVFDDTVDGIRAAAVAGAIGVGVTRYSAMLDPTEHISFEVLVELRDRLFKAGAKHVISTFAQLQATLAK